MRRRVDEPALRPRRYADEPEVVGVPEAAAMLGVSRSLAYDLIARGEFPVPVLKLSARKFRISRRQLERAIHGDLAAGGAS